VGEAAGTGVKLSKGYRALENCTQTTLSLTVECEQNTLILSTDKMNIILPPKAAQLHFQK
jgi:hypothetical protein